MKEKIYYLILSIYKSYILYYFVLLKNIILFDLYYFHTYYNENILKAILFYSNLPICTINYNWPLVVSPYSLTFQTKAQSC